MYTCNSVQDGLGNGELGQGCVIGLNRFEILAVGVREDSGVSGVGVSEGGSGWVSGAPCVNNNKNLYCV